MLSSLMTNLICVTFKLSIMDKVDSQNDISEILSIKIFGK